MQSELAFRFPEMKLSYLVCRVYQRTKIFPPDKMTLFSFPTVFPNFLHVPPDFQFSLLLVLTKRTNLFTFFFLFFFFYAEKWWNRSTIILLFYERDYLVEIIRIIRIRNRFRSKISSASKFPKLSREFRDSRTKGQIKIYRGRGDFLIGEELPTRDEEKSCAVPIKFQNSAKRRCHLVSYFFTSVWKSFFFP